MKIKLVILVAIILFNCQLRAQNEPSLLYKAQYDPQCQAWVDKTMSGMSLKEKVGQLFIYTIAPQNTKKNLSLLQDVVRTYKVGGLLFSGGKLRDQALLTNYAQEQAKTPLLITFDGEWGLSMRLKDTPRFPRNMALGCVQDNELIYEYGREVARECKELGVHVNFAPVADVNINPDNPVINTRSFGEDPHLVAEKVVAYAKGLESGGVLSVSKHFPGHGDTDVDSHKALPVLSFSRARLDSVELYPFREVIKAELGGIMVGHLQVPSMGDSFLPASLSKKIITGILKDELKFKGLVFTDALAMKGVSGNEDLCVKALLAGNDLLLVPRRIKTEMEGVMRALKDGILTEEMINEKCRKVLSFKYALGANRKKKINLSGLQERISTSESKELIRKLHAASITVLGNKRRVLPFHYSADTLLVISIGKYGSDTTFVKELRKYVPVHTIRLTKETDASVRHDLLNRAADCKKVVVSVTSRSIKEHGAFLSALALNVPTVYAIFAPIISLEHLPSSLSSAAAVVAGHSSEEDIQTQVADIFFGMASVDGRLSASVPKLFGRGEGITITPSTPRYYSPEELGMNGAVLARIDSIAIEGIEEGAFPGCRVYVLKNGETAYDKCFGAFTYEKDAPKVKPDDLYDLASLSKTTGTLLAVMKLYDKGKLNLSDKLSDYLPYMKGTDKADITVNELLLHQSGLPSGIPFYKEAIDKDSYKGTFFKNRRDAAHPVQVGRNTYARSDYKFKEGLVSQQPSDTYNICVADNFWLNSSYRKEEERLLAEVSLKEKQYRYSCVNFILLKEIVEHIAGESMDKLLEREFFRPMKLSSLTYLPLRRFPKARIAPTGQGDFLRRTTKDLQGYVHDESAAFFGGVSGNAGLFGSAADVAAVYQMLIDGGTYKGRRYLSEATCHLFTTVTSEISRRGLGFDKPDTKDPDKSPCAEAAPASVFGHTGFTGTCAWADPDNNLVYVFLSNRTYPNAWNNKLGSMNIRPKIQQVLYDSLRK